MQTSGTYELTMILGAATLLLWGVRMVRTGVMRTYGAQIRKLLPRALDNILLALAIGVGAATALQSSIAVAVFTSSLAAAGVIPVADGLLLLLGADAGSAVVAALLTLDLKAIWPMLMFVGYLLHAFFSETDSPFKQLGRIFLGVAMILIALTFMGQVSHGLAESELIRIIISSLGSELVLALLLFAILTWLAHSSIAILLFWSSLVQAGVTTDPGLILAALFGINLGNALPPLLMTWRQAAPAKRIVWGNAVFKLSGVLLCSAGLHWISEVYPLLPGAPGFRVMMLHILFNLGLIVIFSGLVTPAARILERWFSDPPKPADEVGPKYIPAVNGPVTKVDPFPVTALAREVLRILGSVQYMIELTRDMLVAGKTENAEEILRQENKVDVLFKAVRLYTVDLTRKGLGEGDQAKVLALLRYSASLENSGDVISKTMVDIPKAMKRDGKKFSEQGREDLAALFDYLVGNAQLAAEVIMGWNADAAGVLVQRKREFKTMCNDCLRCHIDRLSKGLPNSLESSSAHLDLILDIRWINTQVSSVGYDVSPENEVPGDEVAEELAARPL
jgi:phosphate:Na+ symporter